MGNLSQLIVILQLFFFCGCLSMPSGDLLQRQLSSKKKTQMSICELREPQDLYCFCELKTNKEQSNNLTCILLGEIHDNHKVWKDYVNSQKFVEALSLRSQSPEFMLHIPNKLMKLFTNLAVMKLEQGKIPSLAEGSFSHFPQLQELAINQCGVHQLSPHTFVNMPKLAILNLENNDLVEINREVFDISILKELHLSHNSIARIHNYSFKDLMMLERLEMSVNKISTINTDNFHGLKALTSLSLRANRLTKIGDRTFVKMPELRELYLGQNRIEYIAMNAFEGLGKLRKLDLGSNKLVTLEADVFVGAPGISFLNLSSNSLVTITFDNIKPIVTNFYSNTSFIHIQRNHFVCDCKLAWIKGLINETHNRLLRKSLSGVQCLLESDNNETSDNRGMEMDNNGEFVAPTLDINKSNKHAVHEEDETNEDDELEGEEVEDKIVKLEEGDESENKHGMEVFVSVNGRSGYMKNLSALKLEDLPCPEQSKDDPMASEQPSSRREHAAVPSVASTHALQFTRTIGQCLLTLFTSLFVTKIVLTHLM